MKEAFRMRIKGLLGKETVVASRDIDMKTISFLSGCHDRKELLSLDRLARESSWSNEKYSTMLSGYMREHSVRGNAIWLNVDHTLTVFPEMDILNIIDDVSQKEFARKKSTAIDLRVAARKKSICASVLGHDYPRKYLRYANVILGGTARANVLGKDFALLLRARGRCVMAIGSRSEEN
jgi:hypothetical protein